MRPRLCLAVIVAALLVPGCVPPAPEPSPAPSPAPAASPPPVAPAPPPQAPSYDNWSDAPATPGDWRYATAGEGSVTSIARFGEGAVLFSMACIQQRGAVRLQRHAASALGVLPAITIRTEFGDRTFAAGTPENGASVEIPAGDAFLEAIAFSKGRFAVETGGAPTLYLPTYPEIGRVIEDCRRGTL